MEVFAIVITIAMFAGSLIREFNKMSLLGIVAASTMFMALLLAMICESYLTAAIICVLKYCRPTTCFISLWSAESPSRIYRWPDYDSRLGSSRDDICPRA